MRELIGLFLKPDIRLPISFPVPPARHNNNNPPPPSPPMSFGKFLMINRDIFKSPKERRAKFDKVGKKMPSRHSLVHSVILQTERHLFQHNHVMTHLRQTPQ